MFFPLCRNAWADFQPLMKICSSHSQKHFITIIGFPGLKPGIYVPSKILLGSEWALAILLILCSTEASKRNKIPNRGAISVSSLCHLAVMICIVHVIEVEHKKNEIKIIREDWMVQESSTQSSETSEWGTTNSCINLKKGLQSIIKNRYIKSWLKLINYTAQP